MAIRITGGRLGRRLIRVPARGVRPTQDRVRAALFSSLADRVPGAWVLDLFAGSGALGLEAYSRGAAGVWWVESDRQALAVLKENVRQLCGAAVQDGDGLGSTVLPAAQETRVVEGDAMRFLRRDPPGRVFDLVFADPPYDRDGAWLKNILSVLGAGSMLSASGIFVMEESAQCPVVPLAGWRLLKAREYGETRILMLAKG